MIKSSFNICFSSEKYIYIFFMKEKCLSPALQKGLPPKATTITTAFSESWMQPNDHNKLLLLKWSLLLRSYSKEACIITKTTLKRTKKMLTRLIPVPLGLVGIGGSVKEKGRNVWNRTAVVLKVRSVPNHIEGCGRPIPNFGSETTAAQDLPRLLGNFTTLNRTL